jgi:hypothetical protein
LNPIDETMIHPDAYIRVGDSDSRQSDMAAAAAALETEIDQLLRDWRASAIAKTRFLSFAGGGLAAVHGVCVLCDMFSGDRAGYREWRSRQLRGVSGTSFGAIVAVLVCAGMDWEEAFGCILGVFWDGVCVEEIASDVCRTALTSTPRDALVQKTIVDAKMRDLCTRAFGNPNVTFRDAWLLTNIRLVIVCCDIKTGSNVELCVEMTPDMRIADAMRASCAIPLVVPAVGLDGMLLVDGGMINNFALSFDDAESTLFLSTRFEGLPREPGRHPDEISLHGAYEASKILIDCQHFTMRRLGAIPPQNIVMCPRVFGFLSFPFESAAHALSAFKLECSRSILRAFARDWIVGLSAMCIVFARYPAVLSRVLSDRQ